jgi:type IV pilus assembly protein PilM
LDSKQLIEEASEIILSLLKMGPSSLIGIDIGHSGIRIAEMVQTKKTEYRLINFAHKELPENALNDDNEIENHEAIVSSLRDCMSLGKFKNKYTCIGISGPNTMSKRLTVPDGTPQEVSDQVLWESEQYIPFGVEDSTVSFSILGQNAGGGLDVMVAAVRNDVVEKFQDVIKEAGLKLKVVDLDLFALSNIFEIAVKGKLNLAAEGVLIIDFGANKTNIVIYNAESVVFTREMSMGGIGITEDIQRQMSLSFAEAEDLKICGDENGNMPEEIAEIIEQSLESILSEIKKTITFFMTAAADIAIAHCFITGGASLTPGLKEGLQSAVGVPVNYINPFESIVFDKKKFTDEELEYIASSGSIALGLAARKIKR